MSLKNKEKEFAVSLKSQATMFIVGYTIFYFIISEDVLHRWRLPSIGVKTDANPGRLNSTTF